MSQYNRYNIATKSATAGYESLYNIQQSRQAQQSAINDARRSQRTGGAIAGAATGFQIGGVPGAIIGGIGGFLFG